MTPVRLVHTTVLALGVALVVAPVAAHAASPTPFTITEDIDFSGNSGDPTFTASGELCPSGSFTDDVRTFAAGQGNDQAVLLISTVYTCDDGSGSFYALKHVRLRFTEGGSTNSGPIELLGGTGRYAALDGHGVDDGRAVGDVGLGLISGVLTLR